MIDPEFVKKFTQNLHAQWKQEYPQLQEEFLKLQEEYIKLEQNLEDHRYVLPTVEFYNTMKSNHDRICELAFKPLELKLRTNISNQLFDPLSRKILIPKDVKKLLRQKKVSSYEKVKVLLSIDIPKISLEIYSKYLAVKYAQYKKSLAKKNQA